MSVAQGHEEQPPRFNMSRWAAEMSSRTDGRERITNNSQPYKTAETHCWRWLILQTEIWGRTTEKKRGGGGRLGRKRREGGRGEMQRGGEQEHQVQDTKLYVSFSPLKSSVFQNEIHHFFLIHTSCRGREGKKNWTEERQVLVGKWADSAYFILAVSSILLD